MRSAAAVVLGLGVTMAWCTRSQGAQIPKKHPRIFVKRSELPELVKRCSPGGAVAAEYAELKRRIDGYVSGRKAMDGGSLPGLCIVYQVEKTAGRDASKYVDYLKNGLWGTNGKGGGSKLAGRRHWYPGGNASIFEGYMGGNGCWFAWDAMCYDWFHDALTPAERKKYGEILGRWLHSFQGLKPGQPAKITYRWGSALYNQTWAPCEGYAWGNYYGRDSIGPKTLVSIALHGEGTRYDASVAQWLASFEKEAPGRICSAIDRQGGIWTAGPGHGGAAAQAAVLTFEAWRVATGQDLFAKFAERGLRRVAHWPLLASMPHSGSWPHIDDTGGGMVHGVEGALSRFAPLIARRYRLPVAQWGARVFLASPAQRSWPSILWHDPGLAAAATAEMPLAYHFEGVGHVYTRSAWQDPDATWAFFDCGPHFAGYQSDDDGHFMIYKGGGLAMRGGTDRYSGTRSPSHNVVLVHDPSENPSDGGVLKGGGYNDSGIQRGKMVAYGHSPAWTYACADLTGAYARKKMSRYSRHFLHLRSEPECFVVYDRVVATGPQFPKTWLLHVMNEPRVTKGAAGASQSRSGAGFKVFEGADGAVASAFTPQNNPRRNGRGRFRSSALGAMRLVKLLPERARITARGGKGYDNWGCPHGSKTNRNFGKKGGEGGSLIDRSWWRIEVEPTEPSAATEFLHVMIPKLMPKGAEKTAAELGPDGFGTAELAKQTASELEIKIASGALEWRVTLARSGAPGGSVKRGGSSWVLPAVLTPNGSVPAPPKPVSERAVAERPSSRPAAPGAPDARRKGNGAAEKEAGRLFRMARRAERMGQRDVARRLYQQVVERHPGTESAAAAKKKLGE